MDFMEGLPKSRSNSVIWVVADRLTKIGHFITLTYGYTGQSLIPILLANIFKLHGFLSTIDSDRDPIFVGAF